MGLLRTQEQLADTGISTTRTQWLIPNKCWTPRVVLLATLLLLTSFLPSTVNWLKGMDFTTKTTKILFKNIRVWALQLRNTRALAPACTFSYACIKTQRRWKGSNVWKLSNSLSSNSWLHKVRCFILCIKQARQFLQLDILMGIRRQQAMPRLTFEV